MTDHLLERKAAVSPEMLVHKLPKYKVTRTVETLLHQILYYDYIDKLRFLYLEGRTLELVATFANEITLEQGLLTVQKQVSISDPAALVRIRKIIDETYAEPTTIAELAKISFMSESKLRECFQQQHGMTIYQYVLEYRMERTREPPADGGGRVKEVANLVGYSNISHFSEAFQKKLD